MTVAKILTDFMSRSISVLKSHWYILFSIIAGFVLLAGQIESYDAYNHMFFAKHYRENWFSLVNEQTGGGLDMRSYPPLVFQTVAIISFIIGYEWAYRLVALIFWSLLSYHSSKFFYEYVGSRDAPFWFLYATIFFSIGLLKTVFIFGQLTTLAGLTFGFIALGHYHKFLRNSNSKDFAIFLTSFALVAFSHHFSLIVVTMLLIFITLLELRNVIVFFQPFVLAYSVIFVVSFVVALSPMINLMFEKDSIPKTEIPHSSRYPLESASSYDMWMLTTYGLSGIFVIFPLFGRRLRMVNFGGHIKLYSIAAVLFIFSLGRSTPVNKLVFGNLEHWLTYDRFALVSAFILTFLMVTTICSLVNFLKSDKKLILVFLFIFYVAVNLYMLQHSEKIFFTFGGDSGFEMRTDAITDFLNNETNKSYRYQTFGYGAAISYLFLKTENPTLDTNYFTGQKIPWVRETGIAEIDTIKQFGKPDFIGVFINRSVEYSVKYIITLDNTFLPALAGSGWKKLKESNGIIFWENPFDVEPVHSTKEKINAANFFWGVIPMLTLIFMISLYSRMASL